MLPQFIPVFHFSSEERPKDQYFQHRAWRLLVAVPQLKLIWFASPDATRSGANV
jgi:hypothetical protein